MSFYFRGWAHSPSVCAMWMPWAVLPMALLQGPQPWPPLTRMGHPAPAPAHSHLLPCPRNPMASHLGISGGKACECSIFPRGFTSPHAVRPFASPARCEGRGLRRDAGTRSAPPRSPPLPTQLRAPHTEPPRRPSGAGAIPPAVRGGAAAAMTARVGSEAAQGFPDAKMVLCDSLCKEHHDPDVARLSWQEGWAPGTPCGTEGGGWGRSQGLCRVWGGSCPASHCGVLGLSLLFNEKEVLYAVYRYSSEEKIF